MGTLPGAGLSPAGGAGGPGLQDLRHSHMPAGRGPDIFHCPQREACTNAASFHNLPGRFGNTVVLVSPAVVSGFGAWGCWVAGSACPQPAGPGPVPHTAGEPTERPGLRTQPPSPSQGHTRPQQDWPGKLGFSCPNLIPGSSVGMNRVRVGAPVEGPTGQSPRAQAGLSSWGGVGIWAFIAQLKGTGSGCDPA